MRLPLQIVSGFTMIYLIFHIHFFPKVQNMKRVLEATVYKRATNEQKRDLEVKERVWLSQARHKEKART